MYTETLGNLACKKSNFLGWFLLRKAYVLNFLLVTHIIAIEQGKPRARYFFSALNPETRELELESVHCHLSKIHGKAPIHWWYI